MLKPLMLATLMATLSLAANADTTAERVTMLANTSPPYADARLPEKGLALELVTTLMKDAGYEAEVSIESWGRAMEGVRIGLYDALATAWYSEERSEDFVFSEPYLDSRLILLKLRSAPGFYRSMEDLQGRRLGVRSDYAYGIDFETIPGLKLVEENHMIQNLLDLLNGRVDLVIGDQRTIALQLDEYLLKERHKFQVVPIELPGRSRHVAASRALEGSDKMIEAFNKVLAKAKQDGRHAAIIEKWDARYNIPTQ